MLLSKQVSTDARYFPIQWLMLGLALLALGGTIGYSITLEYSRIDALERERLTTQAKVVDTNLERQLVALNMALMSIRNDLTYWKAQKDSKALVNRHLQALRDAMPGVRTLIITDAEGTVSASNRKQLIGLNFREREYFRAARQGLSPATLYISPPFKTGLGVFTMNVGKVILDAQGTFAGIVSATLDPEFFSVLLNSVLYAPGMRASLIHGDGKIFIEVPDRKDLSGMDLAKPGSRYTLHVKSGRTANLFAAGRAFTTGDERMSAWRTIRPASLLLDKPLMISVNHDMQGIFASWHRDAFMQGGLFGVLVLAAVFGLYFYQRRQQKYDRLAAGHMAELQKSEEKYRIVVENAAESILIAQDGLLKYVNPMTEKLLGYSEEVLTSMPFVELIHPEDREKLFEAHVRIMRGEENQPVHQFRFVTLDGSVRWADSRAVVISWEGKPATLNFLTDATERKRIEEALRESENRYRELSIVDDLTQLYNSRYFYHHLKLEMERSKRYEQPLTLLLLDLDNFKTFNDAYGHVEGDQVLWRLGQVVKRCLRQTDSAYRYGGEEFTILLPMTTSADGAVTAERIRTEFKKETFSPVPGREVHVTVSIGLGQYNPQEEMKVFVHRVDQLMYRGKKNGKDRVCCES